MSKILFGLGILSMMVGVGLFLVPIDTPVHSDVGQWLGDGFTGVSVLPPDEIRDTVKAVNNLAEQVNDAGVANKRWARYASILALIFAALITILSGWDKMLSDRDQKNAFSLTVLIGLLGSVTAASTAIGEYNAAQADARFGCVDTIEDKTRETLDDVRLESDQTAARQYLIELKREAMRCD